MSASAVTTTLPSGDEMPMIGYGTWAIDEESLVHGIHTALSAGYRHVDTAEGYRNEAAVGRALEAVEREEVFLTSKVLPQHLSHDALITACEASLDRLGTEYLDLYLIHWPNPAVSLRESLGAMARLHDRGLVRNVGVSNFTPYQLSCAIHISDIPIAVNQIEFHPWFQRPDLVSYCQEHGVTVQAAAPLGRTDIFGDPVLQAIAAEHDVSVAQVALRWAVEQNVVVLPRSATTAHIRENAAIWEWSLDADQRARISQRDRDHAVYDGLTRDWSDDTWGIAR